MSEAQSRAQQARRERERSAAEAAAIANAAAEAIPDEAAESMAAEIRAGAIADNDPPPPAPKVDHSARLAALDEIRKAREAEEAESTPTHEAEPPESQAAPVAPVAEVPLEAAPAAEEPPKLVKVKIDGVESEVPEADVEPYGGVRGYQIAKAMEKRLAEANKASQDAAALLAQARQTAAPVKPAEPARKLNEIVQDYIPKIQYGTPEEASQAFAEAIQVATAQLVPKPVDDNVVAAKAYFLSQVTSAENKFVREHKDLVDNPMLKSLVVMERDRRVGELRAQGRLPDDWDQFYTQIAVDIRSAMGRPPTIGAPVTSTAAQPTSGLAEKEARKASITALPTASARAALPEEQKPKSREELLAQMRRARGQPV